MDPVARLRALWRSVGPLPSWAVDLALAVGLSLASISSQWVLSRQPMPMATVEFDAVTWLSVLVALGANMPLAFRRKSPVTVLLVISVVNAGAVPVGVFEQGYGMLVALYTVAAYSSRRTADIVLALYMVGLLVTLFIAGWLQLILMQAVVFVTAWALGRQAQARRRDAAELERRAALLERDREDRARLAVVDERGRIARELHDVLAHSMSVMVVQATAAGRLIRTDTERAERAISEVASTGRGSLGEMRRLVGLLRDGEDLRTPQPGLSGLHDLVADFRDAGLPIGLRVDGDVRQLPPSTDLSAYRIVQEALTNTLKHAGSATAYVRVCYGDDAVEIDIRDNGRNDAAAGESGADSTVDGGGGHGILGMRERVALVGGSFECGPQSEGGYRVRAVLPVGADG